MKSIYILFFALVAAISFPPLVEAGNFNDDWTCYTSNNYRGSKKMMNAGEYENCSNWKYYSWKSNCCVKFYFYYRDGNKGEKVLCGDVRDLKNEMRQWGNLKYGYQGGWRNIYKAVFYCEGNNDYAENNNHNNHNNNNNGNHNNNRGGNYNDMLRKGQCVVWRDQGYKNDYEGFMPEKKYYPRNLRYKFWSLQCPDNYEVYWVYKSRNGREEEYTCDGKISDLRSHFNRWNVNNKNNAWDYVQYFEIRKKGMGGNNHAGNNNHNNNNGGGNYNELLRKGQCVVWQDQGYKNNYEGFMPGKKYYPRNLNYKFWSLQCPDNYEVYWVYKSRNGREEEYTCDGKISDLRSHFNRWNVNNRNNAWDYVQYFEIRKKGMGGNNYGKEEDYKNKDWYNKYRNGGYIVFTQYRYYDGRYAGKTPGDYDHRKLGFYPQSIFIPSYSIYLVLEYKARNGRNESITIKESIADLGKYLYDKGVYRDYEKDPYKAITRLAVIRQ
ncbi:MAG: hypothetical protein KDC80_01045 [Saprospiraceae bacterium]|nr:hypothetical protein [Saprospiraceae bacterium]